MYNRAPVNHLQPPAPSSQKRDHFSFPARIPRWLWLLLFSLPLFVALEDSSIWDANEAFYVETPRQMLERGDYLVPYFNGRPRLNKPPLSYWIVALFYRVFSVSLFWERFAMALLGAACILAVFWMGRLLWGETTALWGAGIFATTFRFLLLARRLFIEILMLGALLWGTVFYLNGLRQGSRRWFFLSALCFGLGVLAKGPVALLPLPLLLAYTFWLRRERWSQIPWIGSALVLAAVSGSWFLWLGLERGWEPVRAFFLEENVGRFAYQEFGPRRGGGYYLGVFLGDFFPWSLLFPAALVWGWKRWRSLRDRPALALLGLWVFSYLTFFSLSLNKQEYYILPAYPAAALWIAAAWRDDPFPSWLRKGLSLLLAAAGIFLALLALTLFSPRPLLFLPFLLLGVAAAAFWRRRDFLLLVALSWFYLSGFACFLEPLEQYKPVRPLAETLLREVERAGWSRYEAGYFRFTAPSLVFYLQRPIRELYSLDQACQLLDSDLPVYLLVEAGDFPALQRCTKRELQIVEARPKLYTTARTLIRGMQREGFHHLRNSWAQEVYLVFNGVSGNRDLDGDPRLQ